MEGNTIKYMQVGGRTTAWVPALQKLTCQAVEKPKAAKKKASESDNDAAAPARKQPKKRAAPRPTKAKAAAGMLGHLSRRLLHTRIMI